MRVVLTALLALALLPLSLRAQEPQPGSTLISTLISTESFLVDLDHNITKTWHGADAPGQIAYQLADDSLLRPCRDPNGAFQAGGMGGRIQLIDANDTVVWDVMFSTSQHQQHHDIQPMPNGNVLVIAWELKSRAEARAAGRVTIPGDMWPTMIAELEPVGSDDAEIVWKWHLWDHLIQDADPTKDNYGVIADHPELVDINISGAANGTWDHANSIDFNPALDQIIISCRKLHEFYIIDHSTTIEEAAGHTGGLQGKGGDILYRWGNPQNYDRGTPADQYYYAVHSAHWIDPGLPGAGNILTFNNGFRGEPNNYSSVEEIVPPLDGNGGYILEPGAAYEPAAPVWSYEDGLGFYSQAQGGVQRLLNGNTLITESDVGFIFEVTPDGTVVWSYTAPATVHRALRYWDPPIGVAAAPASHVILAPPVPNPFNPQTSFALHVPPGGARVKVDVYDTKGRRVVALADDWFAAGEQRLMWDGSNSEGHALPSGVYRVRMRAGDDNQTRSVVLVR